jgi:hypothetical protein
MIVALRIRTAGFGWRVYVDGYWGLVTLVLSGEAGAAADGGVAAGTGA